MFAWECVIVVSRILLRLRLFFLFFFFLRHQLLFASPLHNGLLWWGSNRGLYGPRRDPYVSSAILVWLFVLCFNDPVPHSTNERTNERKREKTHQRSGWRRKEKNNSKRNGWLLIFYVCVCVLVRMWFACFASIHCLLTVGWIFRCKLRFQVRLCS